MNGGVGCSVRVLFDSDVSATAHSWGPDPIQVLVVPIEEVTNAQRFS